MSSVISASTTSSTALTLSGDTSGQLEIKTGSTPSTAVTITSGQNTTFAQAINAPNTFGFKNRIINGAMMIDQRNAGASVTFDTSNKYVTDRFYGFTNVGTTTSQQSTVAPAGFINSLLITQSTGGSVVSGSYLALNHRIEGFNVADLGWGTANAQTVTLSFWVRSSITGTFSVTLNNSAANRSYVSNYIINAANTWEQKSITISGDTSGTWLTNSGVGIGVVWNLGYGSNFTTSTLNSWLGSGVYGSTTATTSFATTTGATFYITGVQLEVGTAATSFDYRPYGTELALCQRYFQMLISGLGPSIGNFAAYNTTYGNSVIDLKQSMRAAPTIYQVTGTNYFIAYSGGSGRYFDSFILQSASPNMVSLYNTSGTIAGAAGDAGWFVTDNTAARVGFQAEL